MAPRIPFRPDNADRPRPESQWAGTVGQVIARDPKAKPDEPRIGQQMGTGRGGARNYEAQDAVAAFLASLPGPARGVGTSSLDAPIQFGAMPSGPGGGGGGQSAQSLIEQMLEQMYAQQMQSVQDRYDLGLGAIDTALQGNLGSLGDIRDRYAAEAQRMRQAQAEMLAGALARVSQEEAASQADLAAQGGATIGNVGAAGVDARGLLETQASSQNLLGERLAELQAAAFADREAAAQAVATGGRQQLDLQRLALRDQIERERIQAIADSRIAAAGGGGGGGRGGRGGGGGGSATGSMMDQLLGYPPGTWDSLPAAAQSAEWERYTSGGGGMDAAGMQLAAITANGDPATVALVQVAMELGLPNEEILATVLSQQEQAQQAAIANASKGRGGGLSPIEQAIAVATGQKPNTRPIVNLPGIPNPTRVANSIARLFGG